MPFVTALASRRIPQVAGALVLLAAMAVAGLHTPPARALVRAGAVRALRSQGLQVHLDALTYNLLTLTATAHGVRVTLGGATAPVLTADQLEVDLPWSILAGRLRLETLALSHARVRVSPDTAGALALPAESDAPPLARLPIGTLRLDDAAVVYEAGADGLRLNLSGLTLALTPGPDGSHGRLADGGRLSLRAAGLQLDGSLDGGVAYDGADLRLDGLGLSTAVGEVRAHGTVGVFGPPPTLHLDVDGRLRLGALSDWLAVSPPATGLVSVSAQVRGPVGHPTATVRASSPEVGWHDVTGRDLVVRLAAGTERVSVETVALTLGDGSVEMRGSLLPGEGRVAAEAAWQNVPVRALVPLEPVALGQTRLSGQASVAGTIAGDLGLRADVRLRADTGRAGTLEGRIELTTAGDRWQGQGRVTWPGVLVARGTLTGRPPAPGSADGSVDGDVAIEAPDLGVAAGRVRLLGLWPDTAPALSGGHVQGRVFVGGTLAAPTAAGPVVIDALGVAGTAPLSARAQLAVDPQHLTLTGITATQGGNRAEGEVTLARPDGSLRGRVAVRVSDFDALGAELRGWQPAGWIEAGLDLGGSTAHPSIGIEVTGTDLGVAGQTLGSLSATGSVTPEALTLIAATLRQPDGGQLTASAQYLPDDSRLSGRLEAASARLTPIVLADAEWPLSGTATGRLDWDGPLDAPAGTGQLTLTNLRWQDATVARVESDLTLDGGQARVRLHVPDLALTAGISTALAAPHLTEVTADAAGTDVAALVRHLGTLAPAAARELAGHVRATVSATGTPDAPADATLDVRVDALALTARGTTIRLAAPATARYQAGTASVDGFRLETGATTLTVSGGLSPDRPGEIALTLDGSLADAGPLLAAAGGPAGLELAGRLMATAQVSGSLDRPVLTGDVRLGEGRIAWPDLPPVTAVAGTVTLRDGVIDLSGLAGAWQDATLAGDAHVPLRFLEAWVPARLLPASPDRTATARIRVDNLTPALAEPFVAPATLERVSGTAALTLDATATEPALDALTASVTLPHLSLQSYGVPIDQASPTRVDLDGGLLRVRDWTWTIAGSPLRLAGTAGLTPDAPLDLRLDGPLDLTALSLFLPGGIADGAGEMALAIRGVPTAPIVEGTLRVTGGEVQVADPRIGVSGLTGTVAFRAGRVDIERLVGTLNGGRLTVAGRVEYEGTSLTGGSLSMDATGMALEVPAGVRTEANAALTLTVAERARLEGRLDVVRGGYREPLSMAAALALAGRESFASGVPGGTSTLDALDVNVDVASGEDLLIDNNYGRLALGLDLRLVGTAGTPSVVGRATIREGGVLFLGGRTYVIDRGLIDFSDPRSIVPHLDLTGRTRVDGTTESGAPMQYDITLAITGTPETLTTTLTSTPDRPQADIVSLLATGRLAGQVGGAGAAIARDQFLGYLSGETLGFAARAVGVDAIRLERGAGRDDLASDASLAGDVNPAQRLTVSRRISNLAEVTLSQNLRDTGRLTWIAAVTPGRSIELRALSRDDASRSYEVRHDVAFGGPPLARVSPRRASGPPVTAVRITGETVFPVDTLERRLTLGPGRAFDFVRWQDDRDRLRRLYLDAGYREVRIGARQVPPTTGAPGVILEYAITANPRTTLEVEGMSPPASLRRELEDIWDNAILDVALVADATRAVRAHLAGRGHLRARARVMREPSGVDGDPTVLRVRVSPGARSAQQLLTVSGNTLLSDADVAAAAKSLGSAVWLDPATLAADLRERYRQLGYLAATVDAGPLVFEGSRATLPVRVDEGTPFAFGRITLAGTAGRDAAAVRRDLGVAPGDAFTPARLQQARQALLRAYAAGGFNATAADVATTVVPDSATVDVRVEVREGPRQVITSVTVTGDHDAARGVVDRAMQVAPGDAADLEALYDTRRRLFQTGLFRRADVDLAPVAGAEAPAGTEPVRASVTLVGVQPWRVRYGFSVTDEQAPIAEQGRTFGGGANAVLERQGLFGRPGSSVASVRYTDDRQVARGSVSWPTLFGRAISSRLYAARSRDSVSGDAILAFVTDRTTLTAEQRVSLGTRTQVAYAYQFERNHVFAPDADPDDPFGLDEHWSQARLSASLVVDSRSDPLEPARGLLHSSTVEYGLQTLGRTGRFVKYSLQQLHFAPVGRGIVSASAVRLNMGRGFGQDLILSERFRAGGTNTVRGYADDALGGFDFFGDPIPGQATLVLNQEVRVPVGGLLRVVGFVDAGQVFPHVADLSLRSLQWAGGLGLRLRTPVGLFRVDAATPLPRRDREFRVHFAFGHLF